VWSLVGDAPSRIKKSDEVENVTGEVVGDALWTAIGEGIGYSTGNVSRSVVWTATKDTTAATVATATTMKVANVKDIVDVVCISVMNDYDKIFNIVDKLTVEPKEGMNPVNVVRLLITFDDDQLKKLSLMNKRFRLFYFFRVHEIISLVGDSKILLQELNQLLKKLGDLDEYNQLFVININLEKLYALDELVNIPRDLVKIIIDYCHLFIDDDQDVNLISRKLVDLTC
jgi:hypothetical protein